MQSSCTALSCDHLFNFLGKLPIKFKLHCILASSVSVMYYETVILHHSTSTLELLQTGKQCLIFLKVSLVDEHAIMQDIHKNCFPREDAMHWWLRENEGLHLKIKLLTLLTRQVQTISFFFMIVLNMFTYLHDCTKQFLICGVFKPFNFIRYLKETMDYLCFALKRVSVV